MTAGSIPESFDFYFTRVNDQPSSIFVNLSLRSLAPLRDKPRLLWVWIHMKQPREDGLSLRRGGAGAADRARHRRRPHRRAAAFGGSYDGWGCVVVTKPPQA